MLQQIDRRLNIVLLSLPILIIAMLVSAGVTSAQSVTGEYITTAEGQLRKGPGAHHEVVATIPKGVKINVVGREGYWLKVESKLGGKPGYLDEQYASPSSAQQTAQAKTSAPVVAGAYRLVSETDLRDGPGAKYQVVTRLPAGIKINVVRAEGDWLRIESKRGGKPGYVEKRLVEKWTDR
jgi:uncharacterized protein YgiM (DUF1202 family)